MKVSLNWLKDHLDLNIPTEDISDLLTFSGIEVEGIEEIGLKTDKVVVAEIKSSEPHPDADRLSVCMVDSGDEEPHQIVCGAKNYNVGDRIPLALPGAVLPGDFKIKKGKLRGVKSGGMMCSGKELGLGDDHSGLHIFAPETPIGKPVRELVESDTIFELEITPNRPDCLSHLGVARELSVLANKKLKGTTCHAETSVTEKAADKKDVHIATTEACPFYSARRITGVTVAPSPAWLKRKLEAVGLRPINNIVDITNYVLMEMGQPLHAFDQDKLEGGITVRHATSGETFNALNGDTCPLLESDLVIADTKNAVALAGVMGGEDSGVTETTTSVLLESAYFQPSGVRRTSRRLDLSSDSSYRFERGVDPAQTLGASELATKLILEIAGGTAEAFVLTTGKIPALPDPIKLDGDATRKLLGCHISDGEISNILIGLGIHKNADQWTIPSYRRDLLRPADLIEEVARVYGLDKVPSIKTGNFVLKSDADHRYDFRRNLRNQLAKTGFYECQTIRLISDKDTENVVQLRDDLCSQEAEKHIRVRNPLSDENVVLRPGLIAGLLQVAGHNARMGSRSLAFFETGTVFSEPAEGYGPREREALGLLLSGDTQVASWHDNDPQDASIFDLRGVIESLNPRPELAKMDFRTIKDDRLVLAAEIFIGEQRVGLMGQVWPKRARELDINDPIFVAELDLKILHGISARVDTKYRELPRFPAMSRDVALELPAEFPNASVEAFFESLREPLLASVKLFDVFQDLSGEKLPIDKKSVAYSLTYRDISRTLETDEVDKAHSKILEEMLRELPAQLR